MHAPRPTRTVLALGLAAAWLAAAPARAGEQDPVVFREEGKASYYGDEFQGKKTATGERFDQRDLTAAHPELPLGSEVTVKNPETGKEVEVEVNDRGPYAKGRDIDLSKAAAKELGITKQGVAPVEIEATKEQVEQAIDSPKEEKKVETDLKQARQAADQEGTPQPKPLPDLDPPPQTAGP
jgi:rare lipoprotein A